MTADDLRQAIDRAMAEGGTVPVVRTVICDWGDEDWTEPGGFLFESKAVCPDCAPRAEASARRHGELRFIRARCPQGMPFADWVRALRGPDAAVTVTQGFPASFPQGTS